MVDPEFNVSSKFAVIFIVDPVPYVPSTVEELNETRIGGVLSYMPVHCPSS
jgi:hypothetical protein